MVQLGRHMAGFPRPPKGQISESDIYNLQHCTLLFCPSILRRIQKNFKFALFCISQGKGQNSKVTDAAQRSKLLSSSVCSPAMPTEVQTYIKGAP